MADREYMTSQSYSATLGGIEYSVSVNKGGTATPIDWIVVQAFTTAGIQSAVDLACAANGTVHYPRGTYDMSAGRVNLPKDCDISHVGEDAILDGGGTSECFRFDADNPTPAAHGRHKFTGLEFTDFADWCFRATTNSPGVYSTMESFEVTDCYIHDVGGGASMFCLMETAHIHNNEIDGILQSGSGSHGFRLGVDVVAVTDQTGDYFVHDNYIRNCEQQTAGQEMQGIIVYGTRSTIHNNILHDIKNSADGQSCEGIYSKCKFSDVSHNKLTNAGTSTNGMITLKGSNRGVGTQSDGYGVRVVDNTVVSTGTDNNANTRGIFTSVEESQIEGNWVEGLRGYGITSDTEDCGNLNIRDNTIVKTRGPFAVYITSSGDGLYIKNNTIRDAAGTAQADAYGIYVKNQDTADLSNVDISGNSITMGSETASTSHSRGIVVLTTTNDINGLTIKDNDINISTGAATSEEPIYVFGGTDEINDVNISSNSYVSASELFIEKGAGASARWFIDIFGTGDPNGVVFADIGSSFSRTDGGSGSVGYIKDSGTGNMGWSSVPTTAVTLTSPWTMPTAGQGTSTLVAGEYFVAGFYDFAGAGAPTPFVDDFNPIQTWGSANSSYAAHFMVVAAAGATDTEITVTGTSITDAGLRTTSDTEVIQLTDGAADVYYETAMKWIGAVTVLKTAGTDRLMNYGWSKYWDNSNQNFFIRGGEANWRAQASGTFEVELIHHKATGWTYNAAAVPTHPPSVFSLTGLHGAESETVADEYGAVKIVGGDILVDGGNGEGILGAVITSVPNQIRYGQMILMYSQS